MQRETFRVRLHIVNLAEQSARKLKCVLKSNRAVKLVGCHGSKTNESCDALIIAIGKSRPDLILAGINIDRPQNIEFLHEIRRHMPNMPVICVLSMSDRGASQLLPTHAINRVFLPDGEVNDKLTMRQFATAIQTTIEQILFLSAPVLTHRSALASSVENFEILAIGSSTGGPSALQTLLAALPADLNTPVVIVQHMPAEFTRSMARQLDQYCGLNVSQAEHGENIKSGCVYIAPGGKHMRLTKEPGGKTYINLCDEPPVNFCRPSVDVLFHSIAEIHGSKCLAVVLTGMGRDGLSGCKALSNQGAHILVQDEASSVVWGMPGLVAGAGLADDIVPIDQLGQTVVPLLTGLHGVSL